MRGRTHRARCNRRRDTDGSSANSVRGASGRFVNDCPPNHRQLTAHVLELIGRNLRTDCDPTPRGRRPCRPRSCRSRSSRNIVRAAHAVYDRRAVRTSTASARSEWFGAIRAVQGAARHRRPHAVARGERRDRIVRSAAPLHALANVGLERLQPQVALRSEVAGVVVANPPHEAGRRFGIRSVVVALQPCHQVDGAIGRRVGVNQAMTKTAGWRRFQRLVIGVDHPVDGAIADGVSADVHAGVVQLGNDLPVGGGFGRRIARHCPCRSR